MVKLAFFESVTWSMMAGVSVPMRREGREKATCSVPYLPTREVKRLVRQAKSPVLREERETSS